MIKTKWLLSSYIVLAITSTDTFADDNEVYPFIAVDFSQPASFVSNDNKAIDFAYAPAVAFGFGLDHDLTVNWQVTNKLSIHFTRADFSLTEQTPPIYDAAKNGNADLTSLWASSRLKRLNIFDNITPFIELGAGVTKADYRIDNTKISDNHMGYKAITGIEISTSSNTTISLGVGYSSIDDHVNLSDFHH